MLTHAHVRRRIPPGSLGFLLEKFARLVPDMAKGLAGVRETWLRLKKPVPKWLALVSGNMDQNLRSPCNFEPTYGALHVFHRAFPMVSPESADSGSVSLGLRLWRFGCGAKKNTPPGNGTQV